jgi:hypothetical protein
MMLVRTTGPIGWTLGRSRRVRAYSLTIDAADVKHVATGIDGDLPALRTLPEKWRAMIKSKHRKRCEAEARSNQLLKEFLEEAE